uniref:Uncharacterized protein n=1 Tax=Myotis myotis TaxID=51298 RepID=A0A7J7VYL4_MYOMY|nr:hypothetical protein mMyoMyo1_012235 [Myotis myotis]
MSGSSRQEQQAALDCWFQPNPCRPQRGTPPMHKFVHRASSYIILEARCRGPSAQPMASCSLGPLGGCPPAGLGPLPWGSGPSWQSDIPLAAWQPSGDVHLPAGSRPKLQLDILSATEEAGEASTTTTVLAAISLACG